jgi:hypothetical protein
MLPSKTVLMFLRNAISPKTLAKSMGMDVSKIPDDIPN